MECRHCGAKQTLDADSNFCDQCGAPLAAASPKTDSALPAPDDRPSNGVCPKCGGPVVEVSPDLGVCKKCGEELVSTEARSRKRWGLFITLLAAAIYALYLAFFGPHRWNL
jgi:predicted amidophosphoribosyltransferase